MVQGDAVGRSRPRRAPAMTISSDDARRLPKVLLHDHLDGGLRVATIMELADSIGWTLPETDPDALQAWFTRGRTLRICCSTSRRSSTPWR